MSAFKFERLDEKQQIQSMFWITFTEFGGVLMKDLKTLAQLSFVCN